MLSAGAATGGARRATSSTVCVRNRNPASEFVGIRPETKSRVHSTCASERNESKERKIQEKHHSESVPETIGRVKHRWGRKTSEARQVTEFSADGTNSQNDAAAIPTFTLSAAEVANQPIKFSRFTNASSFSRSICASGRSHCAHRKKIHILSQCPTN